MPSSKKSAVPGLSFDNAPHLTTPQRTLPAQHAPSMPQHTVGRASQWSPTATMEASHSSMQVNIGLAVLPPGYNLSMYRSSSRSSQVILGNPGSFPTMNPIQPGPMMPVQPQMMVPVQRSPMTPLQPAPAIAADSAAAISNGQPLPPGYTRCERGGFIAPPNYHKSPLQMYMEARTRVKVRRQRHDGWTLEQETLLLQCMQELNGTKWAKILKMHGSNGTHSIMFDGKDDISLKDKGRNFRSFFQDNGELMPYLISKCAKRKQPLKNVTRAKKERTRAGDAAPQSDENAVVPDANTYDMAQVQAAAEYARLVAEQAHDSAMESDSSGDVDALYDFEE